MLDRRIALGAALALAACVPEPSLATEPVVYGEDGRREAYEVDATLRALALGSSAAIFDPENLDVRDPSAIVPSGRRLQSDEDLCDDQRFLDQPTAASCSGTLIDDDLYLTAGHCVETEEECRGLRFVFDYAYASDGVLETIGEDDVYACRRLVAHRDQDAPWRDHSIIQLDRPVVGRTPATLRRGALTPGEPLVLIGYPDTIPMKIDASGHVNDARAEVLDRFYASVDAFGGNSGSGVLDAEGRLVGVLSGGEDDYVRRGDCSVVNVLDDACPGGDCTRHGEYVGYAQNAIDDLCASGWPSARLCDRAATCGDGFCSGTETSETCADDCDAPRCGDDVCDRGESATCEADCGRVVPDAWTCEVRWYAALDDCDCACGAPDPDCESGRLRVVNCERGETCVEGVCAPAPDAGTTPRDAGGAARDDASISTDAATTRDAGPVIVPARDEGCACGVAPRRAPSAALVALLALVALAIRARRS
ncbi:trypsin-like serine peptidase [Sandaracinus amylolyticus]|uniref:Trypsin domain protein n=1 Tax=Sandaracinus amylolyticus TaxID=927083 RepID=A0A0F6SEL7_9BACT|nr:serine protease [Sandaracinus amylolyticus]AKF05414.1 Trypsin domain protein [Sandaracinus amylolyticus]